MASIKIAVINSSTVVSNEEVKATIPALQKQVSEHFAPVWGIDADLRFVDSGAGESPDPGEWWLVVLDDSDQAGALGYHDITREGLPLGKVFAKTDQHYGEKWTGTASHELLEMLADPNINLTVFENPNGGGRLYAYEVCDACEAEAFGYQIDGVFVSDFVYPAWFESFRDPKTTRFDYTGNITAPFQLLSGGYIGIYDVTQGGGWTQLTAANSLNFRSRPPVGSRRERRGISKNDRIPSSILPGAAGKASIALSTAIRQAPTFDDVDKQIQHSTVATCTIPNAALLPGGLQNICPTYKTIKPILQLLLGLPLIPESWKVAIKAFMSIMDAVCP